MPEGESKKYPPYWAVPFSSYKEVTDFLRDLETACIFRGQPSDGTVSFGAIARCLQELGRPDRDYRSVHIAGTNGKTSVSRMTAALIQAGGMKVGLYTSPHLGHFRERISVNGQPISEQELVDACNHLKSLMDWAGVELTPFEFLTAAAFFAFRSAKVDYAVVEVGIGGRHDATNVIAPEVSVITNVDYDHMDVLGDTLEQIAAEKSGIIKPLTPVVCGPMQDGPRSLILAPRRAVEGPGFVDRARIRGGGFCAHRLPRKMLASSRGHDLGRDHSGLPCRVHGNQRRACARSLRRPPAPRVGRHIRWTGPPQYVRAGSLAGLLRSARRASDNRHRWGPQCTGCRQSLVDHPKRV